MTLIVDYVVLCTFQYNTISYRHIGDHSRSFCTTWENAGHLWGITKLPSKMTPLTPRRFYGLFVVAAPALLSYACFQLICSTSGRFLSKKWKSYDLSCLPILWIAPLTAREASKLNMRWCCWTGSFLTCTSPLTPVSLETVVEILKCDHSNESYKQYFPVVLFIMLYKVVLNCESMDEILTCDHSRCTRWF